MSVIIIIIIISATIKKIATRITIAIAPSVAGILTAADPLTEILRIVTMYMNLYYVFLICTILTLTAIKMIISLVLLITTMMQR